MEHMIAGDVNGGVEITEGDEYPSEEYLYPADNTDLQGQKSGDQEENRELKLVVEIIGKKPRTEGIGRAFDGNVGHRDFAAHHAWHTLTAHHDEDGYGKENLRSHGENEEFFGEGHGRVRSVALWQ